MDQTTITQAHLDEVGIQLAAAEHDALLAHLNSTLEERVGAEITEALNDDQLAEFTELQETALNEEVTAWLAKHVPEISEIVQDEIDIFLGELAENSGAVNETA